jgi:adenylyltransferase/sulfurtransferase
LKARLDRGDNLVLVDVRENFEWDIARIPNSKLIPLGELASRMSELDSADEMVFICKIGPRSETAVRELQKAGFTKTYNLTGGIREWAEKVDAAMPKY